MKQVTMVFVGGFLGAGKTTLLAQTAAQLIADGKRVGLITNDQAEDLVDTGLLVREGLNVQEVAGGCFCCRFDDLVNAAEKLLQEMEPDVLLGEPVGSCTDISATVLQPCKELYGDWFRVAPFSVLADPQRLREALSSDAKSALPDNVIYIFHKQLEEADLIVINKTDLLSAAELQALEASVREAYPNADVLRMSALTGAGVSAWSERVLAGGAAGTRIAEVDYDRYADGEAVLGWLNATVELQADVPTDWTAFCRGLLERLKSDLDAKDAEIAHLKVLLSTPNGSLTGNVTSTQGAIGLRGELPEPGRNAALVLNARVHMDPDALVETVETCLEEAAGAHIKANVAHIRSLSPGRPTPTHRYDRPV